MDIFLNELQMIREHRERGENRRVIVFDGQAGIGKTRTLDAVIKEAANDGNLYVCLNTLSLHWFHFIEPATTEPNSLSRINIIEIIHTLLKLIFICHFINRRIRDNVI